MRWKLLGCLLALARGIANAHGSVEEDCLHEAPDCVAVGHWNFSVGVGAGARTNPLVNGKVIPLVVIPQFSYYGKRFFIDNLDLGFTLAENAVNSLSLVASPSYDRVFFYRSDLQNYFVNGFSGGTSTDFPGSGGTPSPVKFPPRARPIAYLAGPEWTFNAHGLVGQFDVLHEITGRNGGNELRAALGIPLVQAKGALTADVGITWKSAAIVNYYYGAPGIYTGGSALDPFLKVGYRRPMSGKWSFSTFVDYEELGASIADSPIVAKHYVATGFVGAVYVF